MSARRVLVLLFALSLSTEVIAAQNVLPQLDTDKAIPLDKAMETITTRLQSAPEVMTDYCKQGPFSDVKVNRAGFSFVASGQVNRGKFFLNWQTFSNTLQFRFQDIGYGSSNVCSSCKFLVVAYRGPAVTICQERSSKAGVWIDLGNPDNVAAFIHALNRMVWENSPDLAQIREGEWVEFKQKAQAWRESGAKVDLSEDARRQKLLAEDAVREKNFDSAIRYYEAGLHLQPLWPDAWFNLALIYGEMKDYRQAADRMKHYLELMPNAPDAATARDQVFLWETKEKEAEQ